MSAFHSPASAAARWNPQEAPSSESPAYSVNVLRLSAIRQSATFLRGQASHRRRRRRR
jgi:hypothetical protein